jgi:hypothetical protein
MNISEIFLYTFWGVGVLSFIMLFIWGIQERDTAEGPIALAASILLGIPFLASLAYILFFVGIK